MSFAQDLRASVLQAAMQGKLTEQLETDTPVSELLANIKTEKDRLITEKKIKKEKPLSAISEDDIPFDIPESWEWVRFGDIVYYNMGKTPPRAEPEWWKNDYFWVSIADMPENGHISKTKEMVSQKAIDEKFSKISPAGTMIMSFKLTVGRVSILDIDAVHNEAIISIYPHCDSEKITQDYLFHLLPYIANAGDTKNAIKGKTLNNDSIRNLIVPYPPIEEQKRIVRRIEEIMSHIAELEAIEEELKKLKDVFPADMKAAVLQAAMQGKLTEQLATDSSVDELLDNIRGERRRLVGEGKIKKNKTQQNDNFVAFSDNEAPFEIPDNWRWTKLSFVSTNISDKPFQIKQSEILQDGSYPVVSQSLNLIEGYHNDKNKLLSHKKPLLVFGDHNKTLKYIDFDFVVGADGTKILESFIDTKFLYYHLLRNIYNLPTKSYGRHFSLLSEIPIALPPLEEQNRIVAKLEQILPLIADLS